MKNFNLVILFSFISINLMANIESGPKLRLTIKKHERVRTQTIETKKDRQGYNVTRAAKSKFADEVTLSASSETEEGKEKIKDFIVSDQNSGGCLQQYILQANDLSQEEAVINATAKINESHKDGQIVINLDYALHLRRGVLNDSNQLQMIVAYIGSEGKPITSLVLSAEETEAPLAVNGQFFCSKKLTSDVVVSALNNLGAKLEKIRLEKLKKEPVRQLTKAERIQREAIQLVDSFSGGVTVSDIDTKKLGCP